MTQDLFYYESGYIDESYFVYTADAESAQSSESTLSCDASVIAGGVAVFGSGDLTSTATLTCTISHIEGADLFAFTEAALSAEVSRIRDYNIETIAQFSIATDAVRGIYISAQADSAFNVAVDNSRVRDLEAAVDAAFSLAATVGVVKQFSSTENSLFSPDITCEAIRNSFAVLDTSSALDITANITKPFDATISSQSTLTSNTSKYSEFYWKEVTKLDPDTQNDTVVRFEESYVTANNTLYTVGYNSTIPEDSSDIPVLTLSKFDNNGDFVWSKSVTTTSYLIPYGLHVDSSENLYVVARNAISSSSYIAKFNSSGVPQWQKDITVYPSATTYFNDITVDSSGNVYAVGAYGSLANGVIVKLNSAGTLQYFSTTTSKHYNQVITDGTYLYVSGAITSANNYSGTLIKVSASSASTVSWTRNLLDSQATGHDYNNSRLVFDSSGNIVVADYYSTASGSKMYIAKYNTSGTLLVKKVYNGIKPYDLKLSNNKLYLVSSSNIIAELDESTLDIVWSKQLVVDSGTSAFPSISINSNAIFVSGYHVTEIIPDNINEGIIFKLPLDGSGIPESGYSYNVANVVEGSTTTLNSTSQTVTRGTASSTVTTLTYSTLDQTTRVSDVLYSVYPGGYLLSGNAAISSQFTLTADSTRTISTTVDLNSEFTIIPTATKVIEVTADIQSSGSLLVAAGRLRPFVSLEDTAFELTSTAEVIKSAEANISATASMSINVTKTLGPVVANLTVSPLMITYGYKVAGLESTTDSTVTLTANTIKTANASSTQSVDTTFDVTPDVGKLASANLSSEFTQTTIIDKIFGPVYAPMTCHAILLADVVVSSGVSATLESSGFVVAAVGRLRPFASLEDTAFDQTTTAVVTRDAVSTVSAATDLTASVTKTFGAFSISASSTSQLSANAVVQSGSIISLSSSFASNAIPTITRTVDSQLDSAFEVSANIRKDSDTSADLTSEFVQAATAIKTTDVDSQLAVTSTLSASAKRIRAGISLEFSFADTLVDANVIRALESSSNVETELTAIGTKLVRASASLQSQGFVLAVGREFMLDSAATYVVPAETRLWTIQPETTEYRIQYEVREYTIKE